MHPAAPPARRDCDGARRCRVVSLCRHQRVWRLARAMTASWTFAHYVGVYSRGRPNGSACRALRLRPFAWRVMQGPRDGTRGAERRGLRWGRVVGVVWPYGK